MQACDDFNNSGLRFICVVNTKTRGFCMDKFSEVELSRRGLWKGYFYLDKKKKLDKFAFVWVGRERWYFISNTSYLKPVMIYERYRLR